MFSVNVLSSPHSFLSLLLPEVSFSGVHFTKYWLHQLFTAPFGVPKHLVKALAKIFKKHLSVSVSFSNLLLYFLLLKHFSFLLTLVLYT